MLPRLVSLNVTCPFSGLGRSPQSFAIQRVKMHVWIENPYIGNLHSHNGASPLQDPSTPHARVGSPIRIKPALQE